MHPNILYIINNYLKKTIIGKICFRFMYIYFSDIYVHNSKSYLGFGLSDFEMTARS